MPIDDLVGNPDAFPILRRWDFFNHAGVAPLPRAPADAIRRYAEQAETQAYLDSGWYRDIERLRQLGATLINAHRDEIALVKNTSEGIATVAAGADWSPHDRIITTGVEYPANIYPWMDISRRHGVELVMVPEETSADGARRVPLEHILNAAAHPRTKLLALSHVEFASGQRHDIAAVGRFCRQRGILFCIDAIQTLGVLPVDVAAMHIDYLSADGHKWLLGPEGAGFFYCRRELLPKTRPLVVGWMNVVNCEEYGSYDFTLKPDAGRFESGSYSVPAFLSLKAALELLLSAGIDAVAARVKSLTDRLIAGVSSRGYKVISPRAGEEWSGCLSFTSDRHDHQAIFRTLRHERHTEIAVREGRLRASPHFYNTEQQIDRLVENLPSH
jgi:selenocysteine lyase/cysteine desulfurase